MKPSDQLFKLIKSLDKQEKRYFKLFASTGRESSSYILLFDFINKQEQFDEEEIKRHFKSHALIKQLSVTKNLLYKLILRSMSLYRAEQSMDGVLRELLGNIDFLFEKAFYSECWKIVQRAKKIALKYEKFPLLLEILKWEKKLMADSYLPSKNINEIKKVFDLEMEILEKIKNCSQLLLLQKQISFEAVKTIHVRSASESVKSKSIINSPLLKNEQQALSFDAKTYYYRTLAIYYRFTLEGKKSYEYRKLLNYHWETHPHFIEEYPINYIAVLQNLVNSQLDQKKYKDFSQTIEKFKNIIPKSSAVEQLLFISYYPAKIIFHNNTLLEKNKSFIKSAENEFFEHEQTIELRQRLLFYHIFAGYHFVIGDYKSALGWINHILNQPHSEARKDLHCFARIFNIIIHYELNNMETLEYIVKSAQRFLIKNNRYNELEKTLINFFKKLSNEPNEIKDIFRSLRKDLTTIEKKLYEQNMFSYFNFFAWIDSKIENKPMADIVRTESKAYLKE